MRSISTAMVSRLAKLFASPLAVWSVQFLPSLPSMLNSQHPGAMSRTAANPVMMPSSKYSFACFKFTFSAYRQLIQLNHTTFLAKRKMFLCFRCRQRAATCLCARPVGRGLGLRPPPPLAWVGVHPGRGRERSDRGRGVLSRPLSTAVCILS